MGGVEAILPPEETRSVTHRASDFARAVGGAASRHQRIRPYTPKYNGKVERYQRIPADEGLYARPLTSEAEQREEIAIWIHYDKHHRRRTASGDQPPAPHSAPASTMS